MESETGKAQGKRAGTLDTGHPERKDATDLLAQLGLRSTHRALLSATWAQGSPGCSHRPEKQLAEGPSLGSASSPQRRPQPLSTSQGTRRLL